MSNQSEVFALDELLSDIKSATQKQLALAGMRDGKISKSVLATKAWNFHSTIADCNE
jgi:hypothetical protein